VIADLLRRARERLSKKGRPDPATSPELAPESLRGRLGAILDHYAEKVAVDALDDLRSRVPWIFRSRPDRGLYVEAVVGLMADERAAAFRDGVASMEERIGWECCCRCHLHRRIACPICLQVYGCPVHNEPDPATLHPELLRDPEGLARALHETLLGILDEGDEPQGLAAWETLPEDHRLALAEALRRLVCLQVPPR